MPMGAMQVLLFFAFALGFAIKVPMFPFHTWLPDAHVEAPTAGSVILAGILLKLGTYGFFRFNIPMFPAASADEAYFGSFGVRSVMVFLAIVGIIIGTRLSLRIPGTQLKKAFGWITLAMGCFILYREIF